MQFLLDNWILALCLLLFVPVMKRYILPGFKRLFISICDKIVEAGAVHENERINKLVKELDVLKTKFDELNILFLSNVKKGDYFKISSYTFELVERKQDEFIARMKGEEKLYSVKVDKVHRCYGTSWGTIDQTTSIKPKKKVKASLPTDRE